MAKFLLPENNFAPMLTRTMPHPASSAANRSRKVKKTKATATALTKTAPPPAPATGQTADEPQRTFDFAVLRVLRRRAGLTIAEVSARSGISPAVLSKLERNQSRAELDTLFRIARVFGLSALDLIALAEAPLSHRHSSLNYTSEGFRFQRLSYSNVSLFSAHAQAGAKVSRPEIHSDVHETCWVLSGRIRITLPHEVVELGPGEGVQFDGVQEHTYEALADSHVILAHIKKEKRY